MRAWTCAALAAGLALAGGPRAALAAEVIATSAIDAVTIYPSGAEVVRRAKVRLEAGEHVVVFKDLPAQTVGASIRVEGKATGQLDIGSVDHARAFVLRESESQTTRRQLELEVEKLKDERAALGALIDAAEVQRTFVQNLAQLPTVPPGGQGASPQQDWAQVFTLIGSRHAEAQQKALETKIKAREIDRRIEDLGKQLAQTAPKRQEQTTVRVNVAAAGPLEASLALRYQVTDAGWQALYDARLETGARNVAPKLTLVRRATVRQRTGEPWNAVALTLSTARPSAGTAAPDLKPITVDVQLDLPRPAPVASAPPAAPVGGMVRSSREGFADRLEQQREKAMAEAAPATETAAALEVGSFAAAFVVRDRLTLAETGETKSIFVEEQAIEPTLLVRAVPRVDPKAYLYAKFTIPKTAPYQAGVVSLFRDRTFAGSGRLPQLAPGESHELGFGADDLVKVRHAVGEERRGETGLLTSTRSDERTFRINIRNMHERSISFSVQDQIPVSLNQEIKVDLLGRTPPTRRDIDDKRGVLAWEDKLNPDEERVIEFGYRMNWPANRIVVYR